MTPLPNPPVSPTVTSLGTLPTELASWLANFIEITHKQFAVLWGLLATTGVIGTPAGHQGGYVLLGYAGLAHIAENLFKSTKTVSNPQVK